MPDQWEPESLARLRRERAPLVRKRDALQADVDGYNHAIKKLDTRIAEEETRINGPIPNVYQQRYGPEASGDG